MKPAREARRIHAQLRSLRISRVGLWLMPVIGWVFLPGNSKRQEALKTRLALYEIRELQRDSL